MIMPNDLPKPVGFNEAMKNLTNRPATESPIVHIIPIKDDWFVIYKPCFSDCPDFDASEKTKYTSIYNVIAFAVLESGKIVPLIVGMFHDLCKVDDYVPTETGWDYNRNKVLNGHGDKSVIMVQHLLGPAGLTEQEMLCIRWHMGAFDEKENWNCNGAAVAVEQNVLYTHTADMYASRVMDI